MQDAARELPGLDSIRAGLANGVNRDNGKRVNKPYMSDDMLNSNGNNNLGLALGAAFGSSNIMERQNHAGNS